ncbi:HesB/YadR/YfhF family protein [Bacillus spongiae]|uniref:HesB/YadR/YfhF family protein n=1 Tax=Bacillus spongiae TaxID=2683610 RepID=A0ABU8HJE9_9BACI
MNIYVSERAQKWFTDEMDVQPGDYIRFYVRYGGSSPLHEAFSLGIAKEEPIDASVETIINEVIYYIESKDEWFFDGHHLFVQYNEALDEPEYEYKK